MKVWSAGETKFNREDAKERIESNWNRSQSSALRLLRLMQFSQLFQSANLDFSRIVFAGGSDDSDDLDDSDDSDDSDLVENEGEA